MGGEVRDVVALGNALDTFFTEHKLPRKGVRIGIGTNRVGVRALDIEGIDDPRQLGNAVRFRAHEALSIPMDEAVLDYHVVSEKANEEGGVTRRVVLAAAYREPVDHFVSACRAGGVELMGIDVEAFAMLRAITPNVVTNGASPPRSSPSRSVTTARRSPSPTGRFATSCASSSGAARSSKPRSGAISA